MLIHSPGAVLLYLAALLLTIAGVCLKKWPALTYCGGFAWVAGTFAALLAGAGAREILPVTLVLLAASALPERRGGRK